MSPCTLDPFSRERGSDEPVRRSRGWYRYPPVALEARGRARVSSGDTQRGASSSPGRDFIGIDVSSSWETKPDRSLAGCFATRWACRVTRSGPFVPTRRWTFARSRQYGATGPGGGAGALGSVYSGSYRILPNRGALSRRPEWRSSPGSAASGAPGAARGRYLAARCISEHVSCWRRTTSPTPHESRCSGSPLPSWGRRDGHRGGGSGTKGWWRGGASTLMWAGGFRSPLWYHAGARPTACHSALAIREGPSRQ
jgi:hypothetical protein